MFSREPTPDHSSTALLHRAGVRLTRPRRAILDLLASSEEALRPDQIRDRALDTCPGIGLATVYRTLNLLTDLGLVRRLHQEDRCQGYALASRPHSHHLVCRGCDQVVEFPGREDIRGMIGRLSRQTGFRIEDHLLELVGLCPDCQTEPGPGA